MILPITACEPALTKVKNKLIVSSAWRRLRFGSMEYVSINCI